MSNAVNKDLKKESFILQTRRENEHNERPEPLERTPRYACAVSLEFSHFATIVLVPFCTILEHAHRTHNWIKHTRQWLNTQ